MKKILINASNLHVGGGVQVASSFIFELSLIIKKDPIAYSHYKISVFLSDCVLDNIPSDCDISVFDTFEVINIFGINQCKKYIVEKFSKYNVVFTVFGPLYFNIKGTKTITGFAQAWIAYPNNLAFNRLPFATKLKSKVIYFLKEFFFKKSDILVVEAGHVKRALIDKGYDSGRIHVVQNTVSSVYHYPFTWKKIKHSKSDKFTLGFIGRGYSHKNLSILKNVNNILVNQYNSYCDFLFTLSDKEMEEHGFSKLENFHSIGPINIEQCPAFYQEIDALIFPSLLECFSVTPIEAMEMKKLVIASDLPFVADVCKNAARYFDPDSAESIAYAIYSAMSNPDENEKIVEQASSIISNSPTAEDRAVGYLNIILNN
ncbi:glycosyltransferase [Vibrio cyclitrophicus]|uniref:Glycosyltransferase n=1 Tax=Vibrio cyclitrophicus ZF270 TaxID=1136176 RepID=A0AAN0LLP3_9VIBR|nr:glycosyltransferase [Vibrio cyclitrophicus]OEE04269.1 hypothetical protein OC7_10515 [Vibrio cyclitrophicus ZF270]